MTRLTLVLDVWHPARGGLEAYAEALAAQLAQAGFDVGLLVGERRAAAPDGVEAEALGAHGPAFYARADAWLAQHAAGTVLSFRHPGATADVFLPLGGLLVSSLAARRRSEAWIVRTPRALARALSPKTRAYLERERAFFARGKGCVLASSDVVRREIELRFPSFAGCVEVTGLPVDATRFRPPEPGERGLLRARHFAVTDDAPCLLWIGNDAVRKGLRQARAVLARLHDRKLDARLVLAGYGTEVLSGPCVLGLGRVAAVDELYRAADVLVAPSLEDNLSFSVLEALASGLPVVTTRQNGAADYVTDANIGRVVAEPNDTHALDGAVLAMLAGDALSDARRAARRAAVAACFTDAHFARVRDLLSVAARARSPSDCDASCP